MPKKDPKKALEAGKKKMRELPVEIDQMAAEWDALAASAEDPVIADCYRQQAGTVARLAAMEKKSLRLSVEDLERDVEGA